MYYESPIFLLRTAPFHFFCLNINANTSSHFPDFIYLKKMLDLNKKTSCEHNTFNYFFF